MTRHIVSYSAAAIFLLSLASGGEARAARETDVAASLHGEIGIGLAGYAETGQLEEHGVKVGKLTEGQSAFLANLRFGVLPGLELFGAIPFNANGYRKYSDVSAIQPCNDGTMTDADGNTWVSGPGCPVSAGSAIHLDTDPNSKTFGKYLANAAADPASLPSYTWSGMGDVVVGLRYAPFHEAELGKIGSGRRLGHRDFNPGVTWRLELGLILNSGGNFYTRGPGMGSTGFRFGTSFSKRLRVSEPYVSFYHDQYGSYQASVTDGTGQTVGLTIDPPNDTNLLFGIELIPYEDPASGAKFSVDFAAGGEIQSASMVASGTRLPGALGPSSLTQTVTDSGGNAQTTEVNSDGTLGTLVREDDQVAFLMRLQLHYQIFRYLRLQAGGSIGYVMPHQLESPYSIELSRTILSRFGLELSSTF